MSKEHTQDIAQEWKKLHGDLLAVPPGMYDGVQIYDGPISKIMRNEIFPNLLVEYADRLKVGQALNFIGIGSALDPECFPAIAAVKEGHLNIFLQDPAYSYKRGRELVIDRLNKIGVKSLDEESKYKTSFGNNTYVIPLNRGRLFLDSGYFPQLQIPEVMSNHIVTFSNVLNFIDWLDVLNFIGSENVGLAMFANTKDKGFVTKHPARYNDLKSLIQNINHRFNFKTLTYDQRDGEETAVIMNNSI